MHKHQQSVTYFSQLYHVPCGQVFNQRLEEGHPDRKPRRAVVLGRMRSEPHERPAVYPAFALRATRGSSSLEDQTSSFSTHEFTIQQDLKHQTSPSYAPQSSRFGSEPPSVEDDVDVWRYAIVSCMPETTTMCCCITQRSSSH